MNIAISPKLYIRSIRNFTGELGPWISLRGWSTITLERIQYGWRPPSWKSLSRRNSVNNGRIWTKFAVLMNDVAKSETGSRFGTPRPPSWKSLWRHNYAVYRPNPKPEVDLRHRGRHIEYAVYRPISTKLCTWCRTTCWRRCKHQSWNWRQNSNMAAVYFQRPEVVISQPLIEISCRNLVYK